MTHSVIFYLTYILFQNDFPHWNSNREFLKNLHIVIFHSNTGTLWALLQILLALWLNALFLFCEMLWIKATARCINVNVYNSSYLPASQKMCCCFCYCCLIMKYCYNINSSMRFFKMAPVSLACHLLLIFLCAWMSLWFLKFTTNNLYWIFVPHLWKVLSRTWSVFLIKPTGTF